jgi:hypothetical protein
LRTLVIVWSEIALAVSMAFAPEPSAFSLQWDAPAGCPEAEIVEADISERLAARKASPRKPVAAHARVHESDEGWTLELDIESEGGRESRELDSDECEVLADAVALIVTLAVLEQPELEAPKPPGAVVVTEPKIEIRSESHVQKNEPPTWGTRVFGGGTYGPLPGFGANAGLGVALIGRAYRVELTGIYGFRRTAEVDGDPDIGGDLRMWAIGTRGCGVPRVRRVEFPLCGGLEAGAVHGVGFGVPDAKRDRRAWLALTAGPGVSVRIVRHLALWATVDGVVALLRPAFALEPFGVIHRAQTAGVRALAGIEIRGR